jgi:hypothetical protein
MQQAFVTGVCTVTGNVDIAGRHFRFALTLQRGAIAINQQQIIRFYFRPVQAKRIYEVQLVTAFNPAGDLIREMVANPLMQIKMLGQSQASG